MTHVKGAEKQEGTGWEAGAKGTDATRPKPGVGGLKPRTVGGELILSCRRRNRPQVVGRFLKLPNRRAGATAPGTPCGQFRINGVGQGGTYLRQTHPAGPSRRSGPPAGGAAALRVFCWDSAIKRTHIQVPLGVGFRRCPADGFRTIGELVPTLGHQQERGFDFFDCGDPPHAQAIGGVRPVLIGGRHTDPLTLSFDIVQEPKIGSLGV